MRVPREVRKTGESGLRLIWSEGGESRFDAWTLRVMCRCAACEDEMSGARVLDPESVSKDIRLLRVAVVGNYALSLEFSDGHRSGIYPFAVFCPTVPGGSR